MRLRVRTQRETALAGGSGHPVDVAREHAGVDPHVGGVHALTLVTRRLRPPVTPGEKHESPRRTGGFAVAETEGFEIAPMTIEVN
ncbi:hypothetical protein GCM10017586_25410 [Microbacterium imperiale]|uniref:Uncharacterized protein n=1 Tax=Microbacterium imperiale TaxID=33884 RepID=A0A9W6HJB1_9MICO|nr:hypothetical protein GCM10017544_28620 [Microbacterium imperiale]GLJ80858.1 hypothetical protein GCM10017586_25410 [Microbacterium imperiale]